MRLADATVGQVVRFDDGTEVEVMEQRARITFVRAGRREFFVPFPDAEVTPASPERRRPVL